MIGIGDSNGNLCPLFWESKKIRRIVRSTLAAETLAASDAIDNAYYLAKVFSEIIFGSSRKIPIVLMVDNKSLAENVYTMKNVQEKRLRIDLAAIKELIVEGRLELCWVDTKQQIADALTKKGVNPMKLNEMFQNGFLPV